MTARVRRLAVVLVMSAGAALVLAGCASFPSSAVAPQEVAYSPHSIVRPSDIDGQTPQAYAESQVPLMLRAFVPPPGAWRVKVSPSSGLDDVEASTTDIDKTVADQFADWVAPGTPGIRVDAVAAWVTAGPSYQWIPPGARIMTLTENPTPQGNKHPHPPATVSALAQVRDIVAVINGMSPIPAGSTWNCPAADGGGQYTLTFRSRAAGPVIGTVSLPMSGCAFVVIVDHGQDVAGLLPGDGVGALLGRIARISGVNWPVGGA